MTEPRESRLTGLNVIAGMVLFLVVNAVAWLVANPRWPNEHGPMPRALPFVVLAFVGALVWAARRHPGWRRVAGGFALGYVLMLVGTRGGCTGTWTEMARNLDLTRDYRRRARREAEADSAWQVARAERIAHARSPEGRAYFARTIGSIAGCAFAYRDAHPDLGFPASQAELLDVCDDAIAENAGYSVTLLSPPANSPRPIARLHLRLRADTLLGIEHPAYEVTETGIITETVSPSAPARAVASPVPALLALRTCLLQAVPRGPNADSLSLMALTREFPTPDCAPFARQRFHRRETMVFAVGLDSRISGEDEPTAAEYAVDYQPLHARPDEGFVLLATGPVPGASRRFLVAVDGRVHATSEARDATQGDPPPAPCEADPRVACE